MRFSGAIAILLLFCGPGHAQNKDKHAPPAEGGVVTVPAIIDHNRVIIDVYVPARLGAPERIHAWIDTGNPELFESRRLALRIGALLECMGQICSTFPPPKVVTGDMDISFDGVKSAGSPMWPDLDHADAVLIPGVKAEMNLPSIVLRHYDLLIDFPGRKVTIGTPGSIHFNGVSAKVQINPSTGMISVPSKIDNKKYDLELDLGSPMSSLSSDLFDVLAAAHPDWPHMTGAIGPVDVGGTASRVMRLDRLQFGPLFLTNVAVTALTKNKVELQGRPEDVTVAGLVGVEALLNYRVGIDYAHSTVYFDIGRMFNFPDFDVIGLVLDAEYDGRFTILGVADCDGKPSVPGGADGVKPGDHLVAVDEIPVEGLSMGQVWSMLGGTPGKAKKLTIERTGKEFTVVAQVQHFLPEAEDRDEKPEKKKKSRQ